MQQAGLSEAAHVWTARLVGGSCVLAFFGISTISGGFEIEFHPPFTHIQTGEANLWLSTAFLLFPATWLLAYGYRAWLARGFTWLRERLAALSARERMLGTVCVSLLAVASARICNHLVLLGYPVTDDEWAVRFGGEVLATGRLSVRLPFLADAFPTLFMFVDGGRLTSFDWLGAQVPWAIAALTQTGNWVFALTAALPVPCLMWMLGRRLGPSYGLAAAALFLASPMAFALSMSTHAHLSSRALIALTLALYLLAEERQRAWIAFAQGLTLGSSIICRPYETCFVLAPLCLAETWRTVRHGDSAARVRWLLFALGVALPLLLFLLHSHALTGSWIPARHSPKSVMASVVEPSYWVRFGSNSAFNALRLAVFFAGPLGVLLFAAGVLFDRFTVLLSLGVLVVLLLGLLHDNYGVGMVGPIHYSECVIPLTIVAVHGLLRIVRAWRAASFAPDLPLAVTVVWLVIGLGTFNVLHARALHEAALIQAIVYERIEKEIPQSERPAVLFAPTFAQVWTELSPFRERGSWVFEWRRPKPDFSDDILILHGGSGPAIGTVRTAYPDRHYFFLHTQGLGNWFRIDHEP
jgi:hypothetical protein